MMMMGGTELLMLLLLGGGPLGDLLGMPPGDRDTNLVHAAASDSVLYLEWAERGEGQAGAPGVDGLFADPEVKHFVNRIVAAVRESLGRELPEDNPQRKVMESLPGFAVAFSGRPGCVFAAMGDEPGAGGMPDVRAGVVVNCGDKADEMQQSIASLLAMTGMPMPEKFDRTEVPLPIPSMLHREGNYIVFAIGPTTLDKVLAGLKAGKGGMADHAEFSAAWKELKLERTGLISFVDLKNGIDRILPLAGAPPGAVEPVLEATGLANIENVTTVVGVVDGQPRTRAKLKTVGKPKGLMSLTTGRTMTAKDFQFVPADADLVMAYSVDSVGVLDSMIEMIESIEPGSREEIEEELEEFEEELGVSLRTDVLESLGDVITISNSPGDGGILATTPVLTIEVKKAVKANRAVAKFAAAIDKHSPEWDPSERRRPRGAYLERKEFMGQRLYMVNVVGDDDFVIAPTFMVTRTHFMFALHPAALKSRMRRMKRDSWKAFEPKATDGQQFAYSYMRTSSVLPKVYGILPWVGQSLFSDMQRAGIKLDSFDLPSGYAVLPYMGDAYSSVRRVEDGILVEASAPPFMGTLTSVPSLLVPFTMVGFRAGAPLPAPVAIEAAADAVDEPAAAAEQRPPRAIQPPR